MPTPFHLSGGGGNSSSNGNISNNSSSMQSNYSVDIEQEDPSKVFVELTEIGHGNFGAVYYVIYFLIKVN